MPKPLQEVDTKFEELLQELPDHLVELAYQCKAFVRARKIKTPAELLPVVLSYGGLDQSLREAGGALAVRGQPMCDQSVRERLLASKPWIDAWLKELLPVREPLPLPDARRWRVCEGRAVQAPGATSSDDRVYMCIDVVRVALVEVRVTDDRTGESLAHLLLGDGNAVLADRLHATAQEIVTTRAARD